MSSVISEDNRTRIQPVPEHFKHFAHFVHMSLPISLTEPSWLNPKQAITIHKSGTDTSMWMHLKSMDPLANCQWIKNLVVAAVWRRGISQMTIRRKRSSFAGVLISPVLSQNMGPRSIWARKMGFLWVYDMHCILGCLIWIVHMVQATPEKVLVHLTSLHAWHVRYFPKKICNFDTLLSGTFKIATYYIIRNDCFWSEMDKEQIWDVIPN